MGNNFYEIFVCRRKNCARCKCPKDAHDILHDEWTSVKARLGLKADDAKEPIFEPRDAGYAWAPPGLPRHKVRLVWKL